ncbi:peptidase C39 [Methanothermobacter sp. KEPCO-1]|uniref:C39 family peptidase n=1 Tax=Methanothermobacter sp. KEPCO-1 TaxID=2603820 RepID=UPI0011C8CF4B|nr:cysteine peptidase family C39 domain-containing protein [Methanothermobacter sp. KEPCO-1]QEF94545.1 peptidase C39 [Methanothermobacter sp. KEPCO-1]
MRKSCLWGLLILLTLAVSFNAAAAAETPQDNSSNPTDPMELSTADNPEGNFTDPAEFTIDDNITADNTGVVLQTRNYTCGPAALATLLQNLGINTTEDELADLAETTEDGTTMQGLIKAAKAKGVNAVAKRVSVENLKPGMIVYMDGHYSVIRDVDNETVSLADPSLGKISRPLEEFKDEYSGMALLISGNNTSADGTGDNLSENTTEEPSPEEIENIKGRYHTSYTEYRKVYVRIEYRWVCGWHKEVVGGIHTIFGTFPLYREVWGWYRVYDPHYELRVIAIKR